MEEQKLDEKLIKAIGEVKEIKLTSLEKEEILRKVFDVPNSRERLIPSPYKFFSFVSTFNFSKSRLVYAVSASCLVLVLSTGAVFASNNSLPGNALYPLKVSVVEPAYGALLFSHLEKINYESSLATKRMVEAETLAYEYELDEQKEEILNSLLKIHIQDFTDAVSSFRKDESFDQGIDDDISTNFQASMNAHARVLETIVEEKKNTYVAKQIKISNTARENALKARGSVLEDKEEQAPGKYKKRITDAKSNIEKTTADVNQESVDSSSTKQRIIESTNKTLDNARKLLEESNKDDDNGDSKNSRSKLLDSESSIKEASIFFKVGLGFTKKP